ncbi:MAG: PH domain-containing protein [Prevotellaceae bacterium]|jgi:hypothetical protein|nr:PH domain-containing protein [Prevotellaceae bacterium]
MAIAKKRPLKDIVYQVEAPMDRPIIIITALALLILFLPAILTFNENKTAGTIWFIFATLLSLVMYLIVPRKIIVTSEELVLRSPLFDRKIKRKEILAVQLLSKKDEAGMWRICASGGFFGCYGIFFSKKHSWLYVYASRSKSFVLIATTRKKYVISPLNTEIMSILNSQTQEKI